MDSLRQQPAPDIEEAQACDAVAINRLINQAYRVEDFFKAGDRTSLAEVVDLIERETFLVARDADGAVQGTVRVRTEGERGHFRMLAVAPEAQGSGMGRRLMAAAEAFCAEAGCTWMDLEVASPRTELPAYYEKAGYAVSGTAPWPPGELDQVTRPAHFIVMSKKLEPRAQRETIHGR